MKKLCCSLLLAVIVFAPARAQTGANDTVEPMATATLHIDHATLNTQLATTSAQEERGLMFRSQMPDNDGMLFFLPLGHATFG